MIDERDVRRSLRVTRGEVVNEGRGMMRLSLMMEPEPGWIGGVGFQVGAEPEVIDRGIRGLSVALSGERRCINFQRSYNLMIMCKRVFRL